MQLSKNFTLKELCKSQTAKRLGINNLAYKSHHINNLSGLAKHILQPIRDAVGPYSCESVFRSKELNLALRGAKDSQHLAEDHEAAADLDNIGNWTNYELACYIFIYLPFDQLILEKFNEASGPDDGWVHVSWCDENVREPRGEVLYYDGSTYHPYEILLEYSPNV